MCIFVQTSYYQAVIEDTNMCDITICALCKKQLCAAKLLKCLHSFCLKCLEDVASDGVPGDELPCPTCEETFRIPGEGLSVLPDNSFVDTLLKMRRSSDDDEDVVCEVCATKSDPVTSYCLDCCQNMCDQCSSYHGKFASTKEHKIMSRGEQESASVRLEDTDWCGKHENRREELYCRECGAAICIKCYTEKHNAHNCSDIGTVADEFREQMQRNVEEMEQLTIESQSEERDLRKARDNILDQVTEAEFQVLRRREELTRCIERDTNDLMNDLQYFRDIVTSEFGVSSEKTRKRSAKIDNFKQFAGELIKEGSASAVANITCAMNLRASEIRAQHQKSCTRKRPSVDVTFQPLGLSCLSQAKNKRKINLVGRVTAAIISLEDPQPACSFWETPSTSMSAKSMPRYPDRVFKFGSKHSSVHAVSENPSTGTTRPVYLPRVKRTRQFGAHNGATPQSRVDYVVRQRRQSNASPNFSTSSDEDNIQNSDDDASCQPVDETTKEGTATVENQLTVSDFESSATTVIFSHEAKLYRFSNGSWCLRGVGNMEVVRLHDRNVVYLMMKSKQVRCAKFEFESFLCYSSKSYTDNTYS